MTNFLYLNDEHFLCKWRPTKEKDLLIRQIWRRKIKLCSFRLAKNLIWLQLSGSGFMLNKKHFVCRFLFSFFPLQSSLTRKQKFKFKENNLLHCSCCVFCFVRNCLIKYGSFWTPKTRHVFNIIFKNDEKDLKIS